MTSTLIHKGISFIKNKKKEGADIKIPRKLSDEQESISKSEEIKKFDAQIVEKCEGLTIKQVEIHTEQSGFSYFLDGIERKKVFSYMRSVPIIYGYVAGVILKRTDKKLHSIDLEKSQDNYYLPIKTGSDAPEHYFSPEEIQNLDNIINIGKPPTRSKNKEYPILPEQMVQAAHSHIQTARNSIEESLISEWIKSNYDDGWLFVDGRLEKQKKNLLLDSNIVGVIKSHQACYFDYDEQYKIYSMKKGERSAVFQPENEKGEKENVYSWYLRLHHDKNHGDGNFGLIRVEVPAKQDLLEKVDEISSWILLETKPVAFPASRWDRMIYPIKYCEDYLKSKAPSWTLIDSLR